MKRDEAAAANAASAVVEARKAKRAARSAIYKKAEAYAKEYAAQVRYGQLQRLKGACMRPCLRGSWGRGAPRDGALAAGL